MDLPKSRKSPKTELTPEIIIKSILALEEEKAKKTFSLLKCGLEILVDRGEISPEAAKDFRILKNKLLSKKKEDIMDKNKAEKRGEKDNDNEKILMTAAEIGKMLYDNEWTVTFIMDGRSSMELGANYNGCQVKAEYSNSKKKEGYEISIMAIENGELADNYKEAVIYLKSLSAVVFNGKVNMEQLERIVKDPANAQYAVKTPEEGEWDIRILLKKNEERTFNIFHRHIFESDMLYACEVTEREDKLKQIRCTECGAEKELDISNYVRQNVFMVKIDRNEAGDLVVKEFIHHHEDDRILHSCKVEEITVEGALNPKRKIIICRTCGDKGMYTPGIFRIAHLDKIN